MKYSHTINMKKNVFFKLTKHFDFDAILEFEYFV